MIAARNIGSPSSCSMRSKTTRLLGTYLDAVSVSCTVSMSFPLMRHCQSADSKHDIIIIILASSRIRNHVVTKVSYPVLLWKLAISELGRVTFLFSRRLEKVNRSPPRPQSHHLHSFSSLYLYLPHTCQSMLFQLKVLNPLDIHLQSPIS